MNNAPAESNYGSERPLLANMPTEEMPIPPANPTSYADAMLSFLLVIRHSDDTIKLSCEAIAQRGWPIDHACAETTVGVGIVMATAGELMETITPDPLDRDYSGLVIRSAGIKLSTDVLRTSAEWATNYTRTSRGPINSLLTWALRQPVLNFLLWVVFGPLLLGIMPLYMFTTGKGLEELTKSTETFVKKALYAADTVAYTAMTVPRKSTFPATNTRAAKTIPYDVRDVQHLYEVHRLAQAAVITARAVASVVWATNPRASWRLYRSADAVLASSCRASKARVTILRAVSELFPLHSGIDHYEGLLDLLGVEHYYWISQSTKEMGMASDIDCLDREIKNNLASGKLLVHETAEEKPESDTMGSSAP